MARVVLVEDDDAIRTSLTRALGAAGHAVTAVGSGLDGISVAAKEQPDVVLLDLGLPDLDGRDVLAMVRSVSDVPVIVVTARDDDPSVVRLLGAGADDYVVKPFTASHLDVRIRTRAGRSPSTCRLARSRSGRHVRTSPRPSTGWSRTSPRIPRTVRRCGWR
jgi:two-component system, OmpR family, KDP operon response regulator KdpE